MKLFRFYPLLLTALLQVLPLARVVLTDSLPTAPGASILFKWAAGAVALLGGLHAVAGASTAINSATNVVRTNGVTYTTASPLYRVTLADAQDAIFTAVPLPPGLTMNTNINNGRITGTASNFLGTMVVLLMATDPNGVYPSVSANLFLTIVSKPIFTNQPVSVTNFAGGMASFGLVAGGTGPLQCQWFGVISAVTNPVGGHTTNFSLTLSNLTGGQAGNYFAVITNLYGRATSGIAALAVVDRPALQALGVQGQNVRMSLPVVPNLAYAVESATSAAGPWTTLTNLPPVAAATNLTIPDGITTNTARFYRVRSP